MKSLLKFILLLPLFILIIEICWYYFIPTVAQINPKSPKNEFSDQLFNLLNTANINLIQSNFHVYSREIEFSIKNKNNRATKIYVSSDQNILPQVNALQKLIKIANIKGKEIQFIDLSSKRPYATL